MTFKGKNNNKEHTVNKNLESFHINVSKTYSQAETAEQLQKQKKKKTASSIRTHSSIHFVALK